MKINFVRFLTSCEGFTLNNTRLFTGREYDNETGLYYYRARHCNPQTGRFLQRDPIGQNDQINLYTYVGNNPVMYVDPMGREGKIMIIGSIQSWAEKIRIEDVNPFHIDHAYAPSLENVAIPHEYDGLDLWNDGSSFFTPGGAAVKSFKTSLKVKGGVRMVSKSLSKLQNTKGFSKLEKHFNKHGADFGVKNKEECLELAENFAKDTSSQQLIKMNQYGDSFLKYDPNKNIFISVDKNTYEIRTFFKPIDKLNYFNKQ